MGKRAIFRFFEELNPSRGERRRTENVEKFDGEEKMDGNVV
jgi:hypothetical protein